MSQAAMKRRMTNEYAAAQPLPFIAYDLTLIWADSKNRHPDRFEVHPVTVSRFGCLPGCTMPTISAKRRGDRLGFQCSASLLYATEEDAEADGAAALLRDFTVLLSRPDYIANDRADTYMAHVQATNVKQAQHLAQLDACRADYGKVINTPELEEEFKSEILQGNIYPDDYAPLLVLKGHHTDLTVAS